MCGCGGDGRFPGAMQRVALLRRTGTVTDAALCYGPGSAAHHAAKGGALRCVRGTQCSFPRMTAEIVTK
jgi:hypothetical protein